MNLMPTSTLRWRTFNEKKPYFGFTVVALVCVAFAVGFLFQKLAESKESAISGLEPQVEKLKAKADSFDRAYRKMQATQKEADQIATWLEQRYYWGDMLAEMRRVLIRSEEDIKKKLSALKPGVEPGVWIEQLSMGAVPAGTAGPGANPEPAANNPGENAPAVALNPGNTITLVCRAVSLSNVDSAANTDIVYAVLKAFQEDPRFDPKTTVLRGDIIPDDASGTFMFGVTVGLQNPPNL
jgi:Tfp pilus assembly protein PilN